METKSDLEIAREADLLPIGEIAGKLGIEDRFIEPHGHDKAKIGLDFLKTLEGRPDGKLILVTAVTPTPSGEGKTTTTVGLGDALNLIGKKAMICLREPSLGPCFGMKGGAAGGGYAQVVPMESINLHFTGDMHAIAAANNLLAAMLDNHIYWGNKLDLDIRRITWRRAVDMNDRSLRNMVTSLGGAADGYPREDGFDITAASEIMAILCLADSQGDLNNRLGKIVVGYTRDKQPVTAGQLEAAGAMGALLKDALKPNLVQTLEQTPAFIHGGPFANIAHGCNSAIATRAALKLSDYVVTEAGFGADLGAEKFFDIKCRMSGLRPDAAVVVATARALKMHGGVAKENLQQENLDALRKGAANLFRHVENVGFFGVPVVVAINRFATDSDGEIELLGDLCAGAGVRAVVADHWARGGAGAAELAEAVTEMIETSPANFHVLYPDKMPLWSKARIIAQTIYRADDIIADKVVRNRIKELQAGGYGHFPICMAKTQYSFSSDPNLKNAPDNFVLPIREVRLAGGAEFIILICGDIMTMPGLPRAPSANAIHIDDTGRIEGLF